VIADLVACGDDPPDEVRPSGHLLSHQEEGRLCSSCAQGIERSGNSFLGGAVVERERHQSALRFDAADDVPNEREAAGAANLKKGEGTDEKGD
jgi:hypothetical protein